MMLIKSTYNFNEVRTGLKDGNLVGGKHSCREEGSVPEQGHSSRGFLHGCHRWWKHLRCDDGPGVQFSCGVHAPGEV